MIKTALLTTDTSHHLYYARQLAARFPWTAIVLERPTEPASFETSHPFESERDRWERDALVTSAGTFDDIARTYRFDSVNGTDARDLFSGSPLDVIIVFGTRRITSATLASSPAKWWNLHGGNPEEYRGLDTHLWAIYHRDFPNLVSTLHEVDERLDTGGIIGRSPVPVTPSMPLYQLRAANTKVCVELSLNALDHFTTNGSIAVVPQRKVGRYYSAMPAVLKQDCLRKFDQYTATL